MPKLPLNELQAPQAGSMCLRLELVNQSRWLVAFVEQNRQDMMDNSR